MAIILIPVTFEFVTWCGKGDFADAIKLRSWNGERILHYPGEPNLVTLLLLSFNKKKGKGIFI